MDWEIHGAFTVPGLKNTWNPGRGTRSSLLTGYKAGVPTTVAYLKMETHKARFYPADSTEPVR
jgi:hypothetical protein